jgi:hypothetical protein
MKLIITQKSELTLNLTQHFTFDILDEDGTPILTSQTVECSPSNAVQELTAKLNTYQEEYVKSEELPVGMEIS